jgi:hypothetical protein
MNRPSKKSIKEAIEKLKKPAEGSQGSEYVMPQLSEKKSPNKIRKKGAS